MRIMKPEGKFYSRGIVVSLYLYLYSVIIIIIIIIIV